MSGDFTAFFYGTLVWKPSVELGIETLTTRYYKMAPEIFYGVCYGDSNPPEVIKNLHTLTPAVLHGYCRHRVQHADYPAMVPEEGHSVRGVYATGLTDANMDKLDYFEGSEYERKNVKVKLLKKEGDKEVEGEEKDVIAYVFLYPKDLERGEWDYEQFRREKLIYWARGDWEEEQDPHDKAIVN